MLDKPDDEISRLTAELAARAGKPAEEGYAMPAEYYTSPAFLAHEADNVLRRDWMCVGHVGELRNKGDYFTTDLLGEELLVVRDPEGQVRVLSNVCRHRANRVAEGAGNARRFVCQYHAWTYDTTGALKSAPMMKQQKHFDQSKCGLPEFASEIWKGWIFVNLDGTATPLALRLEGLAEVIRNYHQEDRYLVFMEEDAWDCNWKALFENFMEGYHLTATHPTTLHPITPTKLCRKMRTGEGWTGYHAFYDPDYPPRGPFHPDLTEDEKMNSPMYGIFPNLMVGMGTDFTLFMIIRPDGPGRVRIRWGVTGQKDEPTSGATRGYVDLCRAFNAEDKEKLEILQKALQTRGYQGGPLAPDAFEGTIWDFIQYMGRRLSVQDQA
ncbi:aromatic ring-hydroxylating dioxygenase subunit alpha [Roseovarius faecimaris]|uniref:Aromatic ring-hydroxylating dioxygenase subunit alpha n=1 Tax=Roseovarius faecimaris TaxID=2494550 RepID=A0A6I6IP58_9RHOB|nr:aromatic ring-hydroxylating dioxygenase subunit alpha [Roseovarius faecimaris]QGX97593.1 aromatic ring-hydroxylating dioxygenase subunit alpha [Roseovarius faecimaris]